MTNELYIKKQLSSTGHRFSGESWANDNLTVDLFPFVDDGPAQHLTNSPMTNPFPTDSAAVKPGIIFFDVKNIKETITIKGGLAGTDATKIKNQLIAILQMGGTLDEFKWKEEVFSDGNFNTAWIVDMDFKDVEKSGTTQYAEVKYTFSMVLGIGRIENV